jgi:hypothetical protein
MVCGLEDVDVAGAQEKVADLAEAGSSFEF